MPTLVISPPLTPQPFTIRMVPPAATVSAERGTMACIIAAIASPSMTLSPSITQT